MAHVRKVQRKKASGRSGHAWQVRYRDPDRVERSRTFRTRDDAERFARKVEVSVDEGSYLDPRTRVHDLRHTCASLLVAQSAHPKAIQQHLGHSSISVTMDRYGHLLPDDQQRIADALDRMMSTTSSH